MSRWISALAILGLLLLPSICIGQTQGPTDEELSRMTPAEKCNALAPNLSRVLSNPLGTPESREFAIEIWRNSCGGRPTTQQSPQPIAPDLTANGYISGCKGLISVSERAQYTNDIFGTGMCTGLLKGLTVLVVIAERDRIFCQPVGVCTVQAARVLVAYLQARRPAVDGLHLIATGLP